MIKVRVKDKVRIQIREKKISVLLGGDCPLSSDPLEDNVRNLVDYMIDDIPKQGNMVLASANNTRAGVGSGSNGTEIIGNIVVPIANNLRDGVGAGSNGSEVVGNIELPTASQLLDGVGAGSNGTEIVGNVVLPAVGKVKKDEVFGPANSLTGTYDPFGTGDLSADDTTPLTGQVVVFTPSWTGITPSIWTVDFGDGNIRSTTGATISHKYRKPGTFTVKLIAGSGATAIILVTKTNYITASEEDLSALGTLLSWVNIQDEATLTLSGEGITGIADKVGGGLTWSPNLENPLLKTVYDMYGSVKASFHNHGWLTDPTITSVASSNQCYLSSSTILSKNCATEQFHIFFFFRPQLLSNSDVLGNGSTQYLRLAGGNGFTFRTSAVNTAQSLSSHSFKLGLYLLHEIQIDAGTLRYYLDGTLIHTQTSMSGTFSITRMCGGLSAPLIGRIIGWSIFNGILSGVSLTAIRNYWINKKIATE